MKVTVAVLLSAIIILVTFFTIEARAYDAACYKKLDYDEHVMCSQVSVGEWVHVRFYLSSCTMKGHRGVGKKCEDHNLAGRCFYNGDHRISTSWYVNANDVTIVQGKMSCNRNGGEWVYASKHLREYFNNISD